MDWRFVVTQGWAVLFLEKVEENLLVSLRLFKLRVEKEERKLPLVVVLPYATNGASFVR